MNTPHSGEQIAAIFRGFPEDDRGAIGEAFMAALEECPPHNAVTRRALRFLADVALDPNADSTSGEAAWNDLMRAGHASDPMVAVSTELQAEADELLEGNTE